MLKKYPLQQCSISFHNRTKNNLIFSIFLNFFMIVIESVSINIGKKPFLSKNSVRLMHQLLLKGEAENTVKCHGFFDRASI
jgi:hypothetical protein